MEEKIKQLKQNAWDKIGAASQDDYPLDEQSYNLGRYRAFEDCEDFELKIKQLIAELGEREQLLKFSSSPFDSFRRRELTEVIERLNNILKGE
jgi:hypothetical protein